jgi:hypothetical protein
MLDFKEGKVTIPYLYLLTKELENKTKLEIFI